MKAAGLYVLLLMLAPVFEGQIPSGYKGQPFRDPVHTAGPQVRRLEAALYDLGGEGVAYHDTDEINHGSGELNYNKGHCQAGVASYFVIFARRKA